MNAFMDNKGAVNVKFFDLNKAFEIMCHNIHANKLG